MSESRGTVNIDLVCHWKTKAAKRAMKRTKKDTMQDKMYQCPVLNTMATQKWAADDE